MKILVIPEGETPLECDCFVGPGIEHVLTDQDMQFNPQLESLGYKVGDTVELRPEGAESDYSHQELSEEANGDILCTCTKCLRFRKYPKA